jgi:hypothetical protein
MKLTQFLVWLLIASSVSGVAAGQSSRPAQAPPAEPKELDFIASPPLWTPNPADSLSDPGSLIDPGNYSADTDSMVIVLDGTEVCGGARGSVYADRENGYLCNFSGVAPGAHLVSARFKDAQGAAHTLSARVELTAANMRRPEVGDMTSGNWCIEMTLAQLRVMPPADRRCHTS